MATEEPQTEEVIEEARKEEADLQPDLNAVLVIKKVEDGSISTEVQPIGDVQATEVQTLLELAVKKWRSQIGLA